MGVVGERLKHNNEPPDTLFICYVTKADDRKKITDVHSRSSQFDAGVK